MGTFHEVLFLSASECKRRSSSHKNMWFDKLESCSNYWVIDLREKKIRPDDAKC